MAFNISYVYQAINRFSGPVSAMQQSSNRLTRAINAARRAMSSVSEAQALFRRGAIRTGQAIRTMTNRIRRMNRELRESGTGMSSVAGSVAEVAAAGLAIALPVAQAMEFEDAISNATKKMQDAGKGSKNFNLIKREVLDLAKASNKTAVEIAGVYSAGASGGFAGKELKEFALLTMKASTAFDMATEETGDALTKISGQMNIPINKMASVADTVNHLADSLANVKAGEVLNVIGRAAGNLSSLKITGDQSAGLAAFALQMTGSAEVAGTSLKNLLGDVRKLGQASPQVNVALKNNPTKAIQDIVNKVKGMSEKAQFEFISKNFMEDSAQLMLKAVANTKKLSTAIETAGNKTKIAGSLQREFNAVMDRSSSTMAKNTTKLKELSIVIGTAMLPVVDMLFNSLGGLADALLFGSGIITAIAPILGTAAIAFITIKSAILLAKLAMIAFNFVVGINPIGLIVIALASLVVGLMAAYDNFEAFRNMVDSAWASIKSFFGGDEEKTVTMKIKKDGSAVADAGNAVRKNGNAVADAANSSPISKANSSSSNAITANVNNRSTIDLNIKDKGNNVQSVKQQNNFQSMGTYGVMQ